MISGSTAIGIGITMYLRDEFTSNANRIKQSNKDLHASIEREATRTAQHQRNMYAGLALGGVMALKGIGRMVKSGAEFGYIMKGVGTIVGGTNQQMVNLSKEAKKVGQESIFTSKDVGEGMRFMAMAGMKYGEVMKNITPATNLAAATMSNLGGKGGAADIMTNIMRGFNIENSRAAEMSDKLAYATLNANTNLYDLGDALKYSAATASDLKYDMEDVTAAVMTLGNAGIQGSMAGTAVENMMRYVTIASGKFGSQKQKKALDILGVGDSDLRDSAGNMRKISEILDIINRQMSNMGTGKKQDVLQKIFGVRGKRAGSTLLRNIDQYKGFISGLHNSTGFAGEKASDIMDTLQGSMLKWTNAFENFKIAWTESLEPLLKPLIDIGTAIMKAVTWFIQLPGIGKVLPILITGFIMLRTAAWGFKSVIAGLSVLMTKGTTANSMFFSGGISGWKNMTYSVAEYNRQLQYSIALQNGRLGGASSILRSTGGMSYPGTQGFASSKAVRNRSVFDKKGSKPMGPIKYGTYATVTPGSLGRNINTSGSLGTISKGVGVIGRGIGKVIGLLGPIGMIVSIGFMLYDVVKSIWGNQEEAKEEKKKPLNVNEMMLELMNSTLTSFEIEKRRGVLNNNNVLNPQTTNTQYPPLKQTFIIMADGKETLKQEMADEATKREFFDNKNIYNI